MNEVVSKERRESGNGSTAASDGQDGRASAINLITVSGGRSGAAAATAGTRSGEARRRSINRIRADADGQEGGEEDGGGYQMDENIVLFVADPDVAINIIIKLDKIAVMESEDNDNGII